MKSWSDELRRGTSQFELRFEMIRLGFIPLLAPRSDALAECHHPDTGRHIYTIWHDERSYTRALDRLKAELAVERDRLRLTATQ